MLALIVRIFQLEKSNEREPRRVPSSCVWLDAKLMEGGMGLMDKITLAVISLIAAVIAEIMKSEEE